VSRDKLCREDGSAVLEFVVVCLLSASTIAGSMPLFETQLTQQELMRELDGYSRALLIGAAKGQALRTAEAQLAAAKQLDPRLRAAHIEAMCLAQSSCLTSGGLVELRAITGQVSVSAVIDLAVH
jgi:hypothetical protein